MNAFLTACILILGIAPAIADNDDKPQPKAQGVAGHSIVLDDKAQKLAGLQTVILEAVTTHPEFTAYGKAVNIQPLIELRHRYLVSLTEHSSAKAKFNQAEQSISRQQDLYRHGAGSKRSLQEQQSQWKTNKAQVEAAQIQGKAIVDEALLKWGKTLTEWALSTDSDKLSAFLSGQQTLLQITLPADKQLVNDVQTIYVEASGNRSAADKASLISVAPQTDNTVQGESYFFQTSGRHIRTGMRVAAWIPEQGENQPGVIIPKSALVWHLNQAYVYIKTDADRFSRRNIDSFSATTGGYFVNSGLNPGEQLVVTGGQMLLSEEFRGQIPNEDDDD